jgi:hypothetical protein
MRVAVFRHTTLSGIVVGLLIRLRITAIICGRWIEAGSQQQKPDYQSSGALTQIGDQLPRQEHGRKLFASFTAHSDRDS